MGFVTNANPEALAAGSAKFQPATIFHLPVEGAALLFSEEPPDELLFSEELPTRFWDNVRVMRDSGCWEWVGSTTNGYGTFNRTSKNSNYTHRLAYQALRGEIPDDTVLRHTCRNRACCNPRHLEPVAAQRVAFLRGRRRVIARLASAKGH
jgi:hypothetical protein